MTLERWLRERRPLPPLRLEENMRVAIERADVLTSSNPVQGMRAAGLELLRRTLDTGDDTRSSALDLLTADALISYSSEAASEQPDTLDREAAATIAEVVELLRSAGTTANGEG